MPTTAPKEDFIRDAKYIHSRLVNCVKLARIHCPDLNQPNHRTTAHVALLKAQAAWGTALDKEGGV